MCFFAVKLGGAKKLRDVIHESIDMEIHRCNHKIPVFNPLKTEGILRKFQKVITHPKVEGFQK
jgi:hypothetical protein